MGSLSLANGQSGRMAAVSSQALAGKTAIATPTPSVRVHVALALCCTVLFAFWLIASPPGAMRSAQEMLIAIPVLLAILQLPAAWWHQRASAERRDAALMLPWALVLSILMAEMARTASAFHMLLRDALWQRLDAHLGINIPAMMTWAANHPLLHSVLTRAYASSQILLLAAIFLPALAGKRDAAERFFLANAVGFVVALPIVVLFPAVGPWVGWHFTPDAVQRVCETSIIALRQGAVGGNLFGGTICLPSFHTFWAVTSAHALWPFRPLRYPAILLAALILISTMTTGWHYGVDVIAGLLLAAAATVIAIAIQQMGRDKARKVRAVRFSGAQPKKQSQPAEAGAFLTGDSAGGPARVLR
jgi:membrane-associated phospholipid phosphatase